MVVTVITVIPVVPVIMAVRSRTPTVMPLG
jgi:hypothetical protein